MKRQRSYSSEHKHPVSKKIKFNNNSNAFLFLFDLNQEPYIAYNIMGYLENDSKSFIQMTSVSKQMNQWRTHCASFDSFLMFVKNKSQEQMSMIKKHVPESQFQMKIPINCLFPITVNQIVFLKHMTRIVFSNIKILINQRITDCEDFYYEIEKMIRKIDEKHRKQQNWKKEYNFDFYQLKFSCSGFFFEQTESSSMCSLCPLIFKDFEQLEIYLFQSPILGNRKMLNENHIEKSQFINNLDLDLCIKSISPPDQNIKQDIEFKKNIISRFEFSNLIHLTISLNEPMWLENPDWCSFKQRPKLKSLNVSIDSPQSPNRKIDIKRFMSFFDFSKLKSLVFKILITNYLAEHLPHDLGIEEWNITGELNRLFLSNVKLLSDESNPDQLSDKIKKLKWISNVKEFSFFTSIQEKKHLQLIQCMKKLKKIKMIIFLNSEWRLDNNRNLTLDMSHFNHQCLDFFFVCIKNSFQNEIKIKLSRQWKENIKTLCYENCDLTTDCHFDQLNNLNIEYGYPCLYNLEKISKKFENKQFQSITKLTLNTEKTTISKDQDFSFLNHCKNLESLILKCDEFNLIRNQDKFCPKLKSISIKCNKMIVPFGIFHHSWENLQKMQIIVSKTPISATFLLNKCLDNLNKIKIEAPINELKSWTNLLTLCSKNENIQSIHIDLEKIKSVKIKNREIEKFNSVFKTMENQKLIVWTNIKNLRQ